MSYLTQLDEQTLQDALNTWGYETQIGMAYEELGELITALNHFKRGRIGKKELASEIADVTIMLGQIARMVDPDMIRDEVRFKMERLRKRIHDYNYVPIGKQSS